MKLASGYKWSSPRLCPWPNIIHIFINDLTDNLHNHASLYADDTKLIFGLDPQKTVEIAAIEIAFKMWPWIVSRSMATS
jgi:hypothetical protein